MADVTLLREVEQDILSQGRKGNRLLLGRVRDEIMRQATPAAREVQAYFIEVEMMVELRAIMSRLYGAESLTFDQRRDIAKRLNHIVDGAGELTEPI